MPARFWITLIALALLVSCRCRSEKTTQLEAQLVVSPRRLVLPATYVGQQAHASVSVRNEGGARASVELAVGAPFALEVARIDVDRGEWVELVVRFAPISAGQFEAALSIGATEVTVEAAGLEVPICTPAPACAQSHFDFAAGQCAVSTKPDGSACATRCIAPGGACSGGECRGQFRECDDQNACTLDGCSEETGGCNHEQRVCPAPPMSECRVPRCDSAAGCGTDEAPDGTLCGVDDCLAKEVDVCLLGRCVRRPRPDEGRCSNRWVPTSIPARTAEAMAYDAARQKVVLFGGSVGGASVADTWEWDGSRWAARTPVRSPSARQYHVMAYDAARQRVVVFGGSNSADTWEWDGVTWVERNPALSPPAASGFMAMTYDSHRRLIVLFVAGALWEWDGFNWTERTATPAPAATNWPSMAYDMARQRVVLFSGAVTWEWDGTVWLQRTPATSPPAREGAEIVYDSARRTIVLWGGDPASAGGMFRDLSVWEWDGTNWVQQTAAGSPPINTSYSMVYDSARKRVVVYQEGSTWEWDGTKWLQDPPRSPFPGATVWDQAEHQIISFGPRQATSVWDGKDWTTKATSVAPRADYAHALAYDAVRQRVVLFGGGDNAGGVRAETWEFDGSSWLFRSPSVAPVARQGHAMAWDAARQRVLLFGGIDRPPGGSAINLSDTWEWDGTTWTMRSPALSPGSRHSHAMAYDSVRQRIAIFGGRQEGQFPVNLNDTWEWDGTIWAPRSTMVSPPPVFDPSMAYDTARGVFLLYGRSGAGQTWEWDGTAWLQRTPVFVPQAGGPTAYDPIRDRVVLLNQSATWLFLP